MGRQDLAWGVSPRTARRLDLSLPQSHGGATETLRSLWVLSPLWGSRRDRGGSNDRPGADAPGYSLSPLRGFPDSLLMSGPQEDREEHENRYEERDPSHDLGPDARY